MLAALAGSALMAQGREAGTPVSYLEVKTWRMHNSEENQPQRLSTYLEHGLAPALSRTGAKLVGAFGNLIGPDGPYYVTIAQFASLGAYQETLSQLRSDRNHQQEEAKLDSGSGLPFVRVDSSLLRCFDKMPQPAIESTAGKPPRVFELRTYESQSFTALVRKVGMFNNGEMQIFERLQMRPVFFGETIAGPRQPCLMYMLSYDSLDARDRLWRVFGADPEWNKLKSQPGLSDPEIVANISNVLLHPLPFSPTR